jgi:hypothetical protein
MWFVVQFTANFSKNLDENIGFQETRHFFPQKIGENRQK